MSNLDEERQPYKELNAFEWLSLALTAVLWRRWMFIVAALIGVPLAWFAAKQVPKTYTVEAMILTQPANRDLTATAADLQRQDSVEQLRALEAWLKSEHVFSSLLPELLNGKVPENPHDRAIAATLLRDDLEFELVGRTIIRVRLSATKAEGLGRKLEVVLTKLVSGLIEPDSGVLSATEFMAVQKQEMLSSAEVRLGRSIQQSGLTDTPDLRNRLAHYVNIRRVYDDLFANRSPTTGLADAKRRLERARASFNLSADRLESLAKAAERFEFANSFGNDLANENAKSYVGIFASPERLTIVGRPKDPVLSKSGRIKVALTVGFLVMLIPLGLVVLLELRENKIRLRAQFESIGGLPVVARVPQTR